MSYLKTKGKSNVYENLLLTLYFYTCFYYLRLKAKGLTKVNLGSRATLPIMFTKPAWQPSVSVNISMIDYFILFLKIKEYVLFRITKAFKQQVRCNLKGLQRLCMFF